MSSKMTELLFIVDRSGSMQSMSAETIGGYNSVLEENKKLGEDAEVTCVLFDHEILKLCDHEPIGGVEGLTEKTYVPRGMTALLDAVGSSVSEERARQKAMPKKERPAHTVVTIITDGHENASKEWDYAKVRKLLDKVQKKGWTVAFLGANIDVAAEAESLGIAPGMYAAYHADAKGAGAVYASVARMSTSVRETGKVDASWADEVNEDYNSRG
jgi:hypothetical protein